MIIIMLRWCGMVQLCVGWCEICGIVWMCAGLCGDVQDGVDVCGMDVDVHGMVWMSARWCIYVWDVLDGADVWDDVQGMGAGYKYTYYVVWCGGCGRMVREGGGWE